MQRDRARIVEDLAAQGLVFRTFVLTDESPYPACDWDWNHRDLPHVPFVHGSFEVVPGAVSDGACTALFLQRIAGVRVPVTVTYHHLDASPRSRVYQTALGPFAMVVEARLETRGEGSSIVTTYSVGVIPALRFLLPAVEAYLRRNTTRIDAEDRPLMERRTQLRKWGYRFAGDEGASYARSLELHRANVIAPEGRARAERVALTGSHREVLVGRDDHLGLRLVTSPHDSSLAVYPRMCPHEGASLDACVPERGALRCPWHGRRVAPLVTFDLRRRERQSHDTPHLRLELAAGCLSVEPSPAAER